MTEHFPEIARWAYWCYGQPGGVEPLLWFAEWVMASKESVQQGDPLALCAPEPATPVRDRCPRPGVNK